jgi:hypothetical protein
MDRTAGDGRGVLVNVALVWPGFRGWGLAQPGVEAAIEKLRRAADPGVGVDAGAASGAADPPAASNSCRALVKRDGRAPGAASRFQRTSERGGDRSMSARLRVPHDGAGRHPLCFCTYQSPGREGRGIPERIRMRMVQDGEMMRVAAAVRDASESRHAQEAGAWRCAGARSLSSPMRRSAVVFSERPPSCRAC